MPCSPPRSWRMGGLNLVAAKLATTGLGSILLIALRLASVALVLGWLMRPPWSTRAPSSDHALGFASGCFGLRRNIADTHSRRPS